MALTRNVRNIYQNPLRNSGGFLAHEVGGSIKGGLRNRFYGAFDQRFGGWPQGYLAPSSFVLPQKSGAMSSQTIAQLIIAGSGTLTPAQPMDGSSTFTLSVVNAQLDQIVSAVASGTLSLTAASALLAAAASGSASSTMTLTKPDALCGAIFSVTADGTLTLSPDVSLTATANMEAEGGGPTPLSPEGLAQAVWEAQIALYNDAGSTGEALANAGSAGNPWDSLTASNNDPGTFGELVQKLLTVAKFLGLK